MKRRSLIPKRSRLVVAYFESGKIYHQRSRSDPRRPWCSPDLDPGLLTQWRAAEAEGLAPCPNCWDRDKAS